MTERQGKSGTIVNHADRQAGVAKEASGYCMRRARVMAGLGLREASLTSEFETDVNSLTGELHGRSRGPADRDKRASPRCPRCDPRSQDLGVERRHEK